MIQERDRFREVTLSDLPGVARQIIQQLDKAKVWLFFGELGSGKTTLIKVLGSELGVEDSMSSPSFSIVNEYKTTEGLTIYHFDFYRIKTEMEAMDIGIDDYFYSGSPCFVEWPEQIPSLVPPEHGEVRITIDKDNQRTIAISVHDGKEENRV